MNARLWRKSTNGLVFGGYTIWSVTAKTEFWNGTFLDRIK